MHSRPARFTFIRCLISTLGKSKESPSVSSDSPLLFFHLLLHFQNIKMNQLSLGEVFNFAKYIL